MAAEAPPATAALASKPQKEAGPPRGARSQRTECKGTVPRLTYKDAQPWEDKPEEGEHGSSRLTWVVLAAAGSGAPYPAPVEQNQVPLVYLLAAQGVQGQVADL